MIAGWPALRYNGLMWARRMTYKPTRLSLGVALLATLAASCAPKPLTLGFIGGLSGRNADLGISGRNGALIAVEEANEKGGARGRRVVLEPIDDAQDGDKAVAAYASLSAAGAYAIIGPMTSDMALAIVAAHDKGPPLVSPTASSPLLSGLDDIFLRVNPPNASEAEWLARYAHADGVRTPLVIYDESNKAFSEGIAAAFSARYAELSGRQAMRIAFDSERGARHAALAAEARETGADGLVIVASASEAANLAQQLRKAGYDGLLYGTGWAMTQALLDNGGASIEGMAFTHYFDPNGVGDRWLRFRSRYERQFGRPADFVAGLGWLAASAAIEAYRSAPRLPAKEAILKRGSFDGLQGELIMDRYGDAELERFKIVVRDGAFVSSP